MTDAQQLRWTTVVPLLSSQTYMSGRTDDCRELGTLSGLPICSYSNTHRQVGYTSTVDPRAYTVPLSQEQGCG